MTQSELSDKFDVLLASYEGGIELDEYEKSVFFNKAHVDLVREYYLGINPTMKSYDATEELKRYLSNYLKNTDSQNIKKGTQSINVAGDCLFITLEYITDSNSTCISVIPIAHDEYIKVLNNPFKNSDSKRRALRLEGPSPNQNTIISPFDGTYTYVYISNPTEIDFVNSGTQDVMIHPTFLEIILQRAVELAVQSRGTIKKSNV